MDNFVERLNKFLFEADFVTEESLTEDITRLATETGLSTEDIKKVMSATLDLMEEKRAAAGVDNDKIGPGYAYGVKAVWRPGLMRGNNLGFFRR